MEAPSDPEQSFPPSKKVILLLSGFLMGLIAIVSVLALMWHFDLLAKFPGANSAVPSPDCDAPTLRLGNTTFQIKNVKRGADGSLHVPPEPSGIAYWVQGTEGHPVFVLPPTPQNLAVVSTIDLGSMATATWSDCTAINYPVSAHEPGSFRASKLPDQSREGMTVFFPIDASGVGFVFIAGSSGEQINVVNVPAHTAENTLPLPIENTISPSMEATLPSSMANATPSIENTLPALAANTSAPALENTLPPAMQNTIPTSEIGIPTLDSGEISAEINFSDNPLTVFETTIRIEILISNYGKSPFTLSVSDISLSQSDDTPLALQSIQPDLPAAIQPGETKTFQLVFPRPVSQTSTLKILTVEYDVDVE